MLELNAIHKTYGEGPTAVHALSNLDLTVSRGDFLTIMGPSGSGKSTLLNLLGLLDEASSGTYRLEGREVARLGDREKARIRCRHFGFVFQSFQLFPELTALENVLLPLSFTRTPRRLALGRAHELLEAVDLVPRASHYPSMMSGGEQQRVAIARALAHDPDVLFADEPTGNLPRDMGKEILNILTTLNAQGVTLVMVTHDPEIGGQGRRQVRIVDGVLTEAVPTGGCS